MFQFVSAMSKLLAGDEQWVTDDISNLPLNTLFTTYSKVIVVLANQFLSTNVAVDMSEIVPLVNGLPITLNEFLVNNGNKTLPTLPNVPTLTKQYAKYADAFKAGYSITPTNPTTSVSAQQPPVDKDWLYLTKDGVDYELFYKNCLVNVNGFFHLTDTDNTGIYVVDGMKTARKSNMNHIGIYSFVDVGELQFIPITESMVHKQNSNQSYKDSAYVDLGVDVSNKSVMLVLGGYLHVMDDSIFIPISPTTYKINLSNIPFVDRYFESKEYLDFTSLPLSSTIRNKDQVSITELFSDATVLAYLTLSQSFFVVLNNSNISVERTPVRKTPLPGMFIGYENPIYPLVVQNGKITPFWSTYEDNEWSLTCLDSMHSNRMYYTVDVSKENSVDGSRQTYRKKYAPDAYMLKISSIGI